MDRVTEFLAGYVVLAGAGLAGDPGLKASRDSTGGALSVFEASIADGPPLHVHDREDECFYILDGELSVRCGHARRGPLAYAGGRGSLAGSLLLKY
jgi:mannose-6-phosphate isomerase-like protein (cupin superfamily)